MQRLAIRSFAGFGATRLAGLTIDLLCRSHFFKPQHCLPPLMRLPQLAQTARRRPGTRAMKSAPLYQIAFFGAAPKPQDHFCPFAAGALKARYRPPAPDSRIALRQEK